MGVYTKLPDNAFSELQMNSGIICSTFDPTTGAYSNIIGSTTGGITITAVPSFTDMGEDVDNCPNNTMEAKKLNSWECRVAGVYLSFNASMLKNLLGAADVSDTHVSLNNSLSTADFQTLWFIGDYGSAGFLAVKLSNALNTSGLSLKTSKDSKGQIDFSYLGHYSMANADVVPLDAYIKDTVTMFNVSYALTHATKKVAPVQVASGADLIAQVEASEEYTLPATITITAGGTEIVVDTDYTWDDDTGVIVIKGSATDGAIAITVVATSS